MTKQNKKINADMAKKINVDKVKNNADKAKNNDVKKVKKYNGLFDNNILSYHNDYIINRKKKQTAMLIGFIVNLLGIGFNAYVKNLAYMISGVRANISFTKDNKDKVQKAFNDAVNKDIIDKRYLINPDKSYLDKAINHAKDNTLHSDVFNSGVKAKALQWLCDDTNRTKKFYASTIALVAKATKQNSTDIKKDIKTALLDKKYDNNHIAQIFKNIA